MDFNQLFMVSLVSSKSKNLVISLGLKASDVTIHIFCEICIDVELGRSHFSLKFYNDRNVQNEMLSVDISLPVDAFVRFEGTRIQSSTPFNFSNWLSHIRTVFCYTKPLNVNFFESCERFEVQSLRNTIGNVDFISVESEVTHIYSKEVLKHFTAPNEMFLDRNPFDEACEVQKFFIQNFEAIEFDDVCSLDDILLVNSENAEFLRPISQKEFNRFVKHWIRGSNPRLQYMFLSVDNTISVSREELLKGIQYVDVAEEEKLEISRIHEIDNDNLVKIKRKDGTSAVIVISEGEHHLDVRFIVMY